MRFMAIDPAASSGVAKFHWDKLVLTTTVRPRGKKGTWMSLDAKRPNRLSAWQTVYPKTEAVIIERGFGGMATAVRSQGKHIGWHECMCAAYGIPIIEVNVSEWRRVIAEDQGVSWPKDSKRCKSLSVQLVKQLYGIAVCDDESDAVLLGRAALRMGLVY